MSPVAVCLAVALVLASCGDDFGDVLHVLNESERDYIVTWLDGTGVSGVRVPAHSSVSPIIARHEGLLAQRFAGTITVWTSDCAEPQRFEHRGSLGVVRIREDGTAELVPPREAPTGEWADLAFVDPPHDATCG